MIEIYGLDNGYDQTKLWGKDKQIIFKSRIEETTEDYNAEILEYDGKRYKIGTGRADIEINKTFDKVHKICAYAALSQAVQRYSSIGLVVSLPMSHYRNTQARDSFEKYIKGNVSVVYNGDKKTINIEKIITAPQGAAALYSDHPEQYKNRLQAVLDIGGLTINGCIFEDLQAIPDSMVTIHAGQIILNNKIKSAVNERLGLNVQDYEIPHLWHHDGDKLKDIIRETANRHYEGVKEELRKKNWSIETLDMLGVGGGVLTAQGTLARHFPRLKPASNPVFANAKGLYEIGNALWA